ncbi:MAG: hypothetical protein IPK67_20685 [Planctomycetes bacterium]|nr:hypothetical protein [Planctomycetota bacterium]
MGVRDPFSRSTGRSTFPESSTSWRWTSARNFARELTEKLDELVAKLVT